MKWSERENQTNPFDRTYQMQLKTELFALDIV